MEDYKAKYDRMMKNYKTLESNNEKMLDSIKLLKKKLIELYERYQIICDIKLLDNDFELPFKYKPVKKYLMIFDYNNEYYFAYGDKDVLREGDVQPIKIITDLVSLEDAKNYIRDCGGKINDECCKFTISDINNL